MCCKLQKVQKRQLEKIRRQTNKQTNGVTSSLLELLFAAKKLNAVSEITIYFLLMFGYRSSQDKSSRNRSSPDQSTWDNSSQDWLIQDRSSCSSQDRSSQDSSSQDRSIRTGLVRTVQVGIICQPITGQVWTSQVWDRSIQVWTNPVQSSQDRSNQFGTCQIKLKQGNSTMEMLSQTGVTKFSGHQHIWDIKFFEPKIFWAKKIF